MSHRILHTGVSSIRHTYTVPSHCCGFSSRNSRKRIKSLNTSKKILLHNYKDQSLDKHWLFTVRTELRQQAGTSGFLFLKTIRPTSRPTQPSTQRLRLYCDYFMWFVFCAVVVLTCFVMCGCVYVLVLLCVGVLVMCVLVFTVFCIVCTVFCILSCMYIICFVCTSVRTTATE